MNDQKNWYKTFFNGLALELWHNALPPSVTENEIKFIRKISGICDNAAILDVMCGSGRHAIALASHGFPVTAVDIAEENISLLNKSKGDIPIHTICADILEYPIEGIYGLAICMGNSFSYFSYPTMVNFAARIFNALEPGGLFIVNSGAVAESLLPALKVNNTMQVGDITFNFNNTYLEANKVLRTEMQFIKGGVTEHKTSYHFVFTLAEIKAIFTEAGFTEVRVYSGNNEEEYLPENGQAYFVARR